jgi:hypothetical protein
LHSCEYRWLIYTSIELVGRLHLERATTMAIPSDNTRVPPLCSRRRSWQWRIVLGAVAQLS